MIHLVDTNVLLRYADRRDPLNPVAYRAVQALRVNHDLFTASQNLIELWNVMTRPLGRNGFGLKAQEAEPLLRLLEQLFPLLEESSQIYRRWRDLVLRFSVSGVQVHDARLVAAMIEAGVSRILTFNGTDFHRYADIGIQVVDPFEASKR